MSIYGRLLSAYIDTAIKLHPETDNANIGIGVTIKEKMQFDTFLEPNSISCSHWRICFWLTGPAWRLEVVRSREEMRREAYGFLSDG